MTSTNRLTCQDCGHTDTRGRMHVRSSNFRQVAWCDTCWTMRVRLADLVRESLAAMSDMPLTRRMVEAGIL